MNSLVAYLRNVRTELTHVVWPDWRQAVWHTALLIAGLDYAFTGVVSRLVTGG
jgi:preprotein translocase subunit SecE